jgi:hypothetical protein
MLNTKKYYSGTNIDRKIARRNSEFWMAGFVFLTDVGFLFASNVST